MGATGNGSCSQRTEDCVPRDDSRWGERAMKITDVESLVLDGGQFVRISTDTGLVGLGQSACWGYPTAVHEVLRIFRAYLIGQDPRRIEHHWQYLYRMAPFADPC